MSLSERFKSRRVEIGLTQAELGEIVKLSQVAINKIERGETRDPGKILELSIALKCNPWWLKFGDQYSKTNVLNVAETGPAYGADNLETIELLASSGQLSELAVNILAQAARLMATKQQPVPLPTSPTLIDDRTGNGQVKKTDQRKIKTPKN